MQFLRFVVALFFISIHGAIAAALNSQGCPQDLCYEGVCQVGGVGCPGNAKCMDVGTPGQLGCCAPCHIVHTSPHGMPTGWTTSIVSTHPVPTFPRSIKSIPIPTDRSTSAKATHTHHGREPTDTFFTSIITNGPSFVKSIESLLTDVASLITNEPSFVKSIESLLTGVPSIPTNGPSFVKSIESLLTDVPSIPTNEPSFVKSIESLLTDRSTSTPAPAHTYTYGGGGGSDGCSTGLEIPLCAGTSTGTDMPSPIQTHTTKVVGGGGGGGELSTLLGGPSSLISALKPSGTHTTHHGCPLGGSFPGCAGTSTSKDASPAVTHSHTHFTTTITPTQQGTSTTKDASPADMPTIITNAQASPTVHGPHRGCPVGSDCVPEYTKSTTRNGMVEKVERNERTASAVMKETGGEGSLDGFTA